MTTRAKHRRRGILLVLMTLWCLDCARLVTAAPASEASSDPPNIIVILADDMGFSDIGCFGGEVQTPTLDQLAADGVRMTQFYNMARCCPTRASLLTGLYPHQAGVGAMCQDWGQPGYRGELNDRCVTLAEALSAGGYHTGMVGKWHLSHLTISALDEEAKPLLNFEVNGPISPGGKSGSWPVNRGFDEMWGTIVGVNSFYDPWSLVHNETPTRPKTEDFYYTDFITEKSIALIDSFANDPAGKPFFLYIAHTAPHWPMQAPEETIQKYLDSYEQGWQPLREARFERLKELGIIAKDAVLPPREGDPSEREPFINWDEEPDKAWEVRRMATYAAMIDEMDQGIGKVVAKLDELGIGDNTLILFFSDNGACAENVQKNWYDIPTKTRDGRPIHVGNNDPTVMAGPEETFLSYGPHWANVSNTPFRSFKHYTHEGGIAAPFIAHWPAAIKRQGELETQVGHVIDILPTCLEAAGVPYPAEFEGRTIQPVEGRSLLPALTESKDLDRGPLFWEHEGNRAVRVDDWKLVARHGEAWQLFDLGKDRTELNDLASDQPNRVTEMSRLYDEWAARCNVEPWPVKRIPPPERAVKGAN